ncbi:hypothetical protein AB0M95_25865 [Sphaerisporangium sp. NPDC051017]|uniref:hypothetical protein n=1 Tax=Sphaerisporangium sp. NPDC051017 TaxID=3154636 RepID=UPI00343B8473
MAGLTLDIDQAQRWTDRAAVWASEIDDHLMLARTMFRRSQLAVAEGHAGNAIGLAGAAGRLSMELPAPMRAAIVQQQAQGYALDAEEVRCQTLLDEAQTWAASVSDDGDARSGHGSFCTHAYIEIQRARCWFRLRRVRRAGRGNGSAVRPAPRPDPTQPASSTGPR